METKMTDIEMELLADLIAQDEQVALYQPCFAIYEDEARLGAMAQSETTSYLEMKYGK
jgi:hypothetical protein